MTFWSSWETQTFLVPSDTFSSWHSYLMGLSESPLVAPGSLSDPLGDSLTSVQLSVKITVPSPLDFNSLLLLSSPRTISSTDFHTISTLKLYDCQNTHGFFYKNWIVTIPASWTYILLHKKLAVFAPSLPLDIVSPSCNALSNRRSICHVLVAHVPPERPVQERVLHWHLWIRTPHHWRLNKERDDKEFWPRNRQ